MEGERPIQAVPIGNEEETRRVLDFARNRGEAWHIDSWSKSYTETSDQEYVDLAKEVAVYISKKLRGVDGQKLSRERRKILVGKMLTDIDNIAKKRGIEFERNRGFCFELMYVGEWLENKICS